MQRHLSPIRNISNLLATRAGMYWYAIASLTPALLLILACLFGGFLPLLSVLSITAVVFFMDKLARSLPKSANTGRGLTLFLAALHFALLTLAIVSLGTNEDLSLADKVLIFTGFGLFFGQISNSTAHELIHTSAHLPRRIGVAIYTSLLNGHHTSAHLRVHHVHAATGMDPNSARTGQGFWTFALRAMLGEFTAGFHAESAHRSRAGTPQTSLSHPYISYVIGAAFALILSFMIAGPKGLLIHIALALYAQLQLLLSDYVQHYGLRRQVTALGKPEPIGPAHSWNAPTWYSNAMMLNAPKHSEHHMHPARAFPALDVTPDTMPILPHSLPVMAVLALFPPLWRRVMDPRVAQWQNPA